MPRSRLNDTAALKTMPAPPDGRGRTYESISVRPIDNGFVVSKTVEKDGDYKSSECYMPERPELEADYGNEPEPSSMSKAIQSLKGD